MSSLRIEIENFNGHNFEIWKLKMKDLLVDKEQWIVVGPGTKPTGSKKEGWDKLERRARNTIRICLLGLVLLNVSAKIMH